MAQKDLAGGIYVAMKVKDILSKIEAWRELVDLIFMLHSNAIECKDAALRTIAYQMMVYIRQIAAYELEKDEH